MIYWVIPRTSSIHVYVCICMYKERRKKKKPPQLRDTRRSINFLFTFTPYSLQSDLYLTHISFFLMSLSPTSGYQCIVVDLLLYDIDQRA